MRWPWWTDSTELSLRESTMPTTQQPAVDRLKSNLRIAEKAAKDERLTAATRERNHQAALRCQATLDALAEYGRA